MTFNAHGTHFWNNRCVQIRKSNDLNFESNKAKWPKQDIQNQIRSPTNVCSRKENFGFINKLLYLGTDH